MKTLHIDTPIGGYEKNFMQQLSDGDYEDDLKKLEIVFYDCDHCGKRFPKSELSSDTEDGLICKACQEEGDYKMNEALDRDVDAFREQER